MRGAACRPLDVKRSVPRAPGRSTPAGACSARATCSALAPNWTCTWWKLPNLYVRGTSNFTGTRYCAGGTGISRRDPLGSLANAQTVIPPSGVQAATRLLSLLRPPRAQITLHKSVLRHSARRGRPHPTFRPPTASRVPRVSPRLVMVPQPPPLLCAGNMLPHLT